MQLVFSEFLWGLLVVCIPVVVHLLQLRRPRRVLFTNIGFIQEIELKDGRRRLQDLLVLALRVITLTFLVLAFCQPFIPVKQNGTDSQAIQVAVDNSASMQRPGQSEQLRSQAIAAAQHIGHTYNIGARLQLLGQSARATIGSVYTKEVEALALSKQQVGWGAAVVQQALQANKTGPLYVVSDFQKSEAATNALSQLQIGREVVLVPQIGQAVGNVYVDSVWLNDAFVRASSGVSLHIRLRNGGSEDVQNCPVKVLLNDQQVAAYEASVPARQATETVVQTQVPNQTLIAGRVQVADAPVTFDNVYYFTLRSTSTIQVAEIGPAALTRSAYQQEPLFKYDYMPSQQLDFGRLRRANLVLVNQVDAVDVGLREALVAVMLRGGSVVVIPSARVLARGATVRLLQALGAGDVQWEATGSKQVVRQEVAVPDPRNSFFKGVFGMQARQVAMPSVSPVLQLPGGGTDIMRLRDGEGFLTEFARGGGRLYIFAAPFDKAFSDFTSHSLFVPVLYRLAMLSYRDEQPLAYRIGQNALTLRVPVVNRTTGSAMTYRLVRDSVTIVPAQRQQGQQLRLELPAELKRAGFYQLRNQDAMVTTLAFNAPKAESELASYSVEELRRLMASRPSVHVLDAGQQPAALLAYRAGRTSRPLWRYCLLLALGCLLAESAILRWGRQVAAPVAAGH